MPFIRVARTHMLQTRSTQLACPLNLKSQNLEPWQPLVARFSSQFPTSVVAPGCDLRAGLKTVGLGEVGEFGLKARHVELAGTKIQRYSDARQGLLLTAAWDGVLTYINFNPDLLPSGSTYP